LSSEWEDTKAKEERTELIARMRMLRKERDELRNRMPLGPLPGEIHSAAGEEDVTHLIERADALRDSADKVWRELRGVETRLKEARAEKAIERRMRHFLREDALFEEHDRKLRVHRDAFGTVTAAPDTSGPGAFATKTPPAGTSSLSSNMGETVRGVDERFQVGSTGMPVDEVVALEAERQRLSNHGHRLEETARDLEAKAKALR
jgi:hypothetical protein